MDRNTVRERDKDGGGGIDRARVRVRDRGRGGDRVRDKVRVVGFLCRPTAAGRHDTAVTAPPDF